MSNKKYTNLTVQLSTATSEIVKKNCKEALKQAKIKAHDWDEIRDVNGKIVALTVYVKSDDVTAAVNLLKAQPGVANVIVGSAKEPIAFITTPLADATVTGVVSIQLAPGEGMKGKIKSVKYFAGDFLIGSATVAPFTVSFDSTLIANGATELVADVYDKKDNLLGFSDPISITVANELSVPNGSFEQWPNGTFFPNVYSGQDCIPGWVIVMGLLGGNPTVDMSKETSIKTQGSASLKLTMTAGSSPIRLVHLFADAMDLSVYAGKTVTFTFDIHAQPGLFTLTADVATNNGIFGSTSPVIADSQWHTATCVIPAGTDLSYVMPRVIMGLPATDTIVVYVDNVTVTVSEAVTGLDGTANGTAALLAQGYVSETSGFSPIVTTYNIDGTVTYSSSGFAQQYFYKIGNAIPSAPSNFVAEFKAVVPDAQMVAMSFANDLNRFSFDVVSDSGHLYLQTQDLIDSTMVQTDLGVNDNLPHVYKLTLDLTSRMTVFMDDVSKETRILLSDPSVGNRVETAFQCNFGSIILDYMKWTSL